jgi:hypothetical protein
MGLHPGRAPPSDLQSSADVSIRVGNAQNPSCVPSLSGKENTCVLFGRAPDTTPMTTLFFSEPKMTGIRLPVAINISNSCGFSVPLDSWVRLPKAVYRNVRPGYLSTYRSAENGSHKEALGKFHLKTKLVA